MDERPRVGTGVIIWRDGKVLLGKRLSKAGKGMWCPPGGKLEMKELVENCAVREAEEETGLKLPSVQFITYTNDIYPDGSLHYVTMHFFCDNAEGESRVTEPDKFAEWKWFDWNELPTPLFWSFENLIKNGYKPTI